MSAKVIQSVVVVIRDDHDLVTAFLDWALKNQIYSLREGGGYTGQGAHVASYPLHHAERIEKWIIDNEGKPD